LTIKNVTLAKICSTGFPTNHGQITFKNAKSFLLADKAVNLALASFVYKVYSGCAMIFIVKHLYFI